MVAHLQTNYHPRNYLRPDGSMLPHVESGGKEGQEELWGSGEGTREAGDGEAGVGAGAAQGADLLTLLRLGESLRNIKTPEKAA